MAQPNSPEARSILIRGLMLSGDVARAERELKPLLDAITGCRNLDVSGLMCIPPATESAEASRGWFRRLRELRDAAGLEHCSMGMSSDFEVAIEEGATMVRVGTAIFGPRAPRAAVTEGGA